MSGKRKRGNDVDQSGLTSGKPLTAIAAARLRTEAAAKVVKTPEVALEQVDVPESPLLQSRDSENEEVEIEEEVATVQHNLKLCNWRSEPQNILSETDDELRINLSKHTTIALIGCFDFTVLRGAININGANIGTVGRDGQKNRVHRAFVPATHAIFKIRGLDSTNHISIKTCKPPASLASINPAFHGLWNEDTRDGRNRSFRVVCVAPSRRRCTKHPSIFLSTI